MYLEHFQLGQMPFSMTPDRRFCVGLPSHERAQRVLTLALRQGEGFVKLTGEVGTGKTFLCRKLLNELGPSFVTAYLPDPVLSPTGLREALAQDLGIPTENASAQTLWAELRDRLMQIHERGQRCVWVIDEAQALTDASLESLRLLTNLETGNAKLLQVVLIGQPELDDRLNHPSLRQLAQRVVFSHRLEPMTCQELDRYLHDRMETAGRPAERLFSLRAVSRMHRASGGIARLTNLLAHKALIVAFSQGRQRVKSRDVRRAIADSKQALGWVHTTPRSRLRARRRAQPHGAFSGFQS